MNTKQLAEELNSDINWDGFFNLVNDLGSQLNERQLRFLKARLIEKAIANLSKNVKWVDKIGQDHQYRDIRIETKFASNSLTTKSGAWKKNKRTSEIKLTNTLGSSEGRSLPETFDFLMIVDNDCVAVIAHEDIKTTSNGDGLKARFSYDDLEFVTINKNMLVEKKQINILEKLDSMLEEIIKVYNDA